MEILPVNHPIRLKKLKWHIKALDPILYYPLWENGGATARNYAPRNMDTANGTSTGVTLRTPAKVGKGYTFDGSNDEVTIPANSIPAFSGDSTLGLIVKNLDSTAADQTFFDSQWGDNTAGGWQLIVNTGNLTHNWVGDKTDRDDVAPTGDTLDLTDDFHFLVITKSTTSGEQRFYDNGVLNNTNSSLSNGTTEPDTDILLTFGVNMVKDTFTNCILQHVFVLDYELEVSRILKLAKIAGF